MNQPCNCGSGQALGECCGPRIAGAGAPTAEALMRSRYTAYALKLGPYLLATSHSSTCPAQLDVDPGPRWMRLEIRAVEAGGALDDTGTVEFVAHWQDGKHCGALHETSRFVREAGRWRYLDGVIHSTAPSGKVGRNDPCPCGGGRKFKQCCG